MKALLIVNMKNMVLMNTFYASLQKYIKKCPFHKAWVTIGVI